jgi:hypothetical protein
MDCKHEYEQEYEHEYEHEHEHEHCVNYSRTAPQTRAFAAFRRRTTTLRPHLGTLPIS